MPVQEIESSEQFIDLLRNENGTHDKKYVFADFYANWCGPCKRIAPVLEEFSETYGEKILFCKLNIEECEVAASSFKVMALPTFMIWDTGCLDSAYQPIVGANADAIEARLKDLSSDSKVEDKISDDF